MYHISGPKVPHSMHVLQASRRRSPATAGIGAARYDPRLFPSDPYFPPVYGNFVKSRVSIPEAWWYPHPYTHYFHFDTSGIDGLGSWWNPFSWSWLKSGTSGGETYVTHLRTKSGQDMYGKFVLKDGIWWETSGSAWLKYANENEIEGTTGTGRSGQGWLAKIFGFVGSGIKSVGGGMYSLFNQATGQTETKGYNELTPQQQLAAKQSEQWNASVLGQVGFPPTIFGIDTNVALILTTVGVVGIFFAMKQGGGSQQPIIVIPALQQQRTRKAKKNPRRRRHNGRIR